MKRRGAGLFSKYFAFIGLLVSAGLIASGAISLFFSYQETRASLVALQREKGLTAAVRIEQFLRDIESQLGWTTLPMLVPEASAMESRRLDFLKVLRQLPAVTEVQHLDAQGREQLKVSRLAMDVMGSGLDFAADPRFTEARRGRTWFGPVYFRKETEPYMTIAIPEARDRPGVTAVEVNLKFIWDVVSRIRIGQKGVAFVVDDKGFLVAHPDISFVLRKVNLSDLPQVKAALAAAPDAEPQEVKGARDANGEAVLSAHARVPQTGWTVFVEEPESAVYAPLYAAMVRTALLLLAGVALSIMASLALARRMVKPVRELTRGAERIGQGDLGARIEVGTGDELEVLAERFNTMTAQLRESYAGLEQKVEARTAELRESLEQQTATADVLKVISASPTDVKPVFDAIVRSARDLGGASDAYAWRFDGERIQYLTGTDTRPEWLEFVAKNPVWTDDTMAGRAIRERRPLQVNDVEAHADFGTGGFLRGPVGAARSFLAVPMLRDDVPIGALSVAWTDPGQVPEKFVRLLQTFAAQAVIAVENVRLFNELQARNRDLGESLQQQTATAEVLRVISSSPTDVMPVFDSIVRSARELGEGFHAYAFRFDGTHLSYVTGTDERPRWLENLRTRGPWMPDRSTVSGRAVMTRATVQIPDMAADPEYSRPMIDEERSVLGVPMMREGSPIGVLTVTWRHAGEIPQKFVRVLETFAAQAVIAVENVRLFNELQSRNRELGESLEQQTATADVLKVISASPTDVMPVFEAIVRAATTLGEANTAQVFRYDGERIHYVASHGTLAEWREQVISLSPWLPDRKTMTGRVIAARRAVEIEDMTTDPDYDPKVAAIAASVSRRLLGVPLMREGEPIGVLTVSWREPGRVAPKFVRLLETFADQAVIAIENVRLVNEIQEKSRALEAANRHKSEFLANMSHELRTPLNAIIGFSEVMLGGMAGPMGEQQKEFTGDIRDSGRHLLALINDILDLSKIEAGKMELERARFDLRGAMANAMTLVRGRAERAGIALDTEIAPEVDEYLGDERKFKQIVLNLLSNAVKFTPEGGTVTLAARRVNGAYVFDVRDTGVGIAPGDQGLIFEEFRQVGSDYERKAEGTGLGLALTRRLVQLHGGEIRVESIPGRGSTFTFTLPLETEPA